MTLTVFYACDLLRLTVLSSGTVIVLFFRKSEMTSNVVRSVSAIDNELGQSPLTVGEGHMPKSMKPPQTRLFNR